MNKYVVTFILVLTFGKLAFAKDLGVYGEMHSIAEQDIVEFIQKRLLVLQKNGELIRLQEKFANNSISHAKRPKPILNISKTSFAKSWLYDPSITVSKDIIDDKGNIIAIAGTRINPLAQVKFTSTLIFFNGDNEDEVLWAKKFVNKHSERVKLILVNGSIKEQTDIFKRAVYFDQEGKLISKFGIWHTPAIVKQEGLSLRVSEVMP